MVSRCPAVTPRIDSSSQLLDRAKLAVSWFVPCPRRPRRGPSFPAVSDSPTIRASSISPTMSWRKLLMMVLLAGLVRAGHHFIRLAILAAIGLAGMYMLHMLAQDYNKITRPRPAAVATRALFRALTKRHVTDAQGVEPQDLEDEPREWGVGRRVLRQVLMQDPLGCARKLVCQLSTPSRGPGGLRPHEAAILRLVQGKRIVPRTPYASNILKRWNTESLSGVEYRRHSEEEENDEAATEFRAAQALGKSSKDPAKCASRYSKCSIEPRTVLKILQSIG